jgi:hypothetical protein
VGSLGGVWWGGVGGLCLAVAKEVEEEEEEERKGAKIRVFIFCVPFVSVTRFVAAVFHGSTFLTTSLFYLSHALTTQKKITCILGQLEMHRRSSRI